jgi:beta-lactamase regulating signal transducer with metallopeptidase domain
MNEWQNLALAVLVVVVAEIANEIIIVILRVRNATTRFRIRLISLFSCFFVFSVLPLRIIELIIPSGESLVTGESNSLYVVEVPVVLAPRLSQFAYISIILVAAAVVCFVVMLFSSKIFVSRVLKCVPTSDSRLLGLVEEVSRELGVTVHNVTICKKKCDAFVYGYPPSLAVGTDLLEMLNDEELRIVIRHELYHIKGKDTLLKPLVTAMCIIFMYNPMVWFLSTKLSADRECRADQGAITSSRDTWTFLTLLLKVQDFARAAPHSLAVHWIGSTRRIDFLFSRQKTSKIPVIVCLVLTFSSLFFGGTHLFGERYLEIQRSDVPFDSVALDSTHDPSDFFLDIPMLKWYEEKNNPQRVGIPLQESELLELLKASRYKEGGVTVRLATLSLWKKTQLFGGNDIDFDADCHLVIQTDTKGHIYVQIEKVKTSPEELQDYNPRIPFEKE